MSRIVPAPVYLTDGQLGDLLSTPLFANVPADMTPLVVRRRLALWYLRVAGEPTRPALSQ